MPYQAKVSTAKLETGQLGVEVTYFDPVPENKSQEYRKQYNPHGMDRTTFLNTVVLNDLNQLNKLSPLLVDLQKDIDEAKVFEVSEKGELVEVTK